MSKINVHPDHLRRSGGKLSGFGGKLADGGQKLETAGQNLVSHASGDRSGIGAVVAKAFGKGVQITGKVFSEGGRVVEGAGKRLGTTADLYEEADGKGAGLLKRLHPDAEAGRTAHGGSRTATSVGSGRGSTSRHSPARTQVGDNPRQHAIPGGKKCTGGDPVDMATGDVLLTETDLDLPGTLPLQLTRTHISSYRVGRLFGPSWASMLDQRLDIDEQGIVFVAADGMLLSYPTPDDDAVLPVEGPRWPLRRDGHDYVVEDGDAGQRLHFGEIDRLVVLTAVTDRLGNRIDIDHDSAGVPLEVRHSGGYRIQIRSQDGLITALLVHDADDAGVPVRGFGYDDARRLVEVTNGSGKTLALRYDPEGRLTGWTDRNGVSYRYGYDAAGRCVRGDGDGGHLSYTFDYDRENLVTTATDSLGHSTRYQLNEALQIVEITDPLGGTTRAEFDRYDRLLVVTDPLGRTTRYEYTEAGDLTRVTRPDGTQNLVEYNDLRLPVVMVDPDGATWRRTYSPQGALLAATDPAGATTRFGYDDRHRLATITDPAGAVTRYTCTDAGLPNTVTDPAGATTRYDRNPWGRITAIHDPAGGVTRLSWALDGHLTARILPDGATDRWIYDGEGNPVEHHAPHGAITRTTYGPFDRPVARVDPTGARTLFGYDTELRLTTVADPSGLVWRYDYDAAGNLIGQTDFNGATLRYTRDAAGQLTSRSNSLDQTTVLTYDPLGRMVRCQTAEEVSTFVFDPADRLVRATNATTDLILQRDVLGRVLAETCNGRTVTSGYDILGHRTHRATPSGAISRWVYDPAGNPTALHTAGQAMLLEHDLAGRETARRVGAVLLSQTWDVNHRLHTQALTAPGAGGQRRLLQRRAYTYRADSAVTHIIDQLAGVRTYDLDALGRATTVHAPQHQERYSYDPSGNITASPLPPTADTDAAGTRQHSGTQLRSTGGIRYEHDAHGRLIARHSRTLSGKPRTWRYTWDSQDRLVAVTDPDQTAWHYSYDALGRRVSKQRLGADGQVVEQTLFTWDGLTLAEQADAQGRVTSWDYRPGTVTPLAQTERLPTASAPQEWIDAQFYAIVSDLIGTPTELVDPTGELAWRQTTTHWGAPMPAPPQRAYCPLRFPGQYHDAEMGQNYNYFRHYDPTTATYTSPDPIGLHGGPNPHSYVPNPTAWSDPFGLQSCDTNDKLQRPDPPRRTLYHYTNEKGLQGILDSQELWASTKEHNPKDARYGDGQYLSDIVPGTKTRGQLSAAFLRVPYAGHKFTHFVEVDVTGLDVYQVKGRPNVFYIPGSKPLNIAGRIVRTGQS
ncbi:HYD1 signature containing ADP-ribosyltransferase family protein [Kutzneria sp. NPDC052558]|uniref:HYD1 signature containing ADP-ribosyltransferase family protein n=1 Tax=Kutzneria sp. NPDC052558 TaxID=3364121 RepID=UPI0037CCA721